jgi:predicted RNA binding protein with dsRBD fold (UPF0201 family)
MYLIKLLLLFFITTHCYADINIKNNHSYIYILKKYGLNQKDIQNYMIEADMKFLGWSKNGLIAYIIKEPNEARDFENVNLIIQNIITDKIKIVEKWRFIEKDKKSFSKSIELYNDKIYHIMQKYHINSNNFKLQEFPITLDKSKKITINKQAAYATYSDFSDNEKFLTKITFSLQIEKNYHLWKKKKIYQKNFKPSNGYYDLITLGYIQSPYQNKIAILVAKVYRGWEYKPHVIDLQFIGASLTKAFK